MFEAAQADLVLLFSFCEIAKKPRNGRNKCVVVFPIEQIRHALVVLATDYQGMASATFVIKKGKHIDVHLDLVLVQINIVG